jgi:hypothetical protein
MPPVSIPRPPRHSAPPPQTGARGNADGKRKADAVDSKVCMRLCCGAYAPDVTSCLGFCVQGEGGGASKKPKTKASGEAGSSSRSSTSNLSPKKKDSGEAGSSSRSSVGGEGGGASKKSQKKDSAEAGSSSRSSVGGEEAPNCSDYNCYLLRDHHEHPSAKPCGLCALTLVCS